MALRPLLIGEVLDAGVREFRRHLGVYFRIVAPVALGYGLVSLVIRIGTIPTNDELLFGNRRAFPGSSILTTLLGIVVFVVIDGAVVHAASESLSGRRPTAKASLKLAARRTIPLAILAVLWAASIAVSSVTVIGWIVALAAFWVSIPVCMLERRGPLSSLRRSRKVTRGRFWPTLATILTGGLMVFVFVYLWIIVLLVSGSATSRTRGAFVAVAVVSSLLSLVVQIVFVPLIGSWQAVMYTDLCVRQEGYDLVLAIEGLEPVGAVGAVGAVRSATVAASPWSASSNEPPTMSPSDDSVLESVATPARPPWAQEP